MRRSGGKARGRPLPIFGRIREILESARAGVVRTVNTTQVVANWLIGREIVEEEQRGRSKAGYGERLLADLSSMLMQEFGRGFSVTNLQWFRQFYVEYPDLLKIHHSLRGGSASTESEDPRRIHHAPRGESGPPAGMLESWFADTGRRSSPDVPGWIPGTVNPNLSWTHYRILLKVGRPAARAFYELESARAHWTARELERQIGSLLYDRLRRSRDRKGALRLATHGQEILRPVDVLKDPLVIEFLGLPESPRLVESELETALIDNLKSFLLELGRGFAFVARQDRITLDGDHFYIDLVFYHTVLKCFVVIDLKVGKLTHEDLGQIQFYVNYFDRERRTRGDQPTLGIILCTDKNEAVVRYTLGEQQRRNIFTTRYQLHLPTEEELSRELRREVRALTAADVGARRPRSGRMRRRSR